MRIPSLVVPLLGATLLAACAAGPASSRPAPAGSAAGAASTAPSPAGPPRLDGRTFLSVRLSGHELVKGTSIKLTFIDGHLAAQAGCNTLNGAYSIGDGGGLGLTDLATTDMACDADRMAQDQWFAEFLRAGRIVLFDGNNLTLTNGPSTLTLVDEQTTNLPLEGTLWVLDGLVTGDVVASVPQGVQATLVFGSGRVRIESGCNHADAPATIRGETIGFGPIESTAMQCADPVMAVERQIQTVLAGSQPYAIAGASLTIGGGGKTGATAGGTGQAGLMLRGASAAPLPLASSDPGPT